MTYKCKGCSIQLPYYEMTQHMIETQNDVSNHPQFICVYHELPHVHPEDLKSEPKNEYA